MNIEELQAALKDVDDLTDGSEPDTFWTIVEHARLVANPNIEAAADDLKLHLDSSISEDVDWLWVAEMVVAAALTPGDTERHGFGLDFDHNPVTPGDTK